MNDSPNVEQQAVFGDGEDVVETTGEPVETTWGDWGEEMPPEADESRIEVEQASEFGVDDRGTNSTETSEQAALAADVDEGQVTLGGEDAEAQSLW